MSAVDVAPVAVPVGHALVAHLRALSPVEGSHGKSALPHRVTVFDSSSDQGLTQSNTTTTTDTQTSTDSGNAIGGSVTDTTSESINNSTTGNGADDRGTFSASTTVNETDTGSDSGNTIAGTDSGSLSDTTTTTDLRTGGDSATSYSQSSTDTTNTTSTDSSNSIGGSQSQTATTSDALSLSESGTDLTSNTRYNITDNDGSSTTNTDTGNNLSGADSLTTTGSSNSSMVETGSNSAGAYSLTKTVTDSQTGSSTGNDIGGSASTTTTDSNTTTTSENNTSSADTSSFVETSTNSTTTSGSGNNFSGDFSNSSSGTNTTTLQDNGTDSAGSFSVQSSDSTTTTANQTGNNIDGSFTTGTTATDSYSMSETGSAAAVSGLTLTETGTLSTTSTKTGNSIVGTYSTSQTGSDSFGLTETGTASGGSFTEGVTGNETNTLSESGNSVNQTFTRSDSGSGSYSLTDSGAGAILSNGSGNYGYGLTEGGNWRAGAVSQSETGSDRYSLLEAFNNVADTANGTPGHLDFSPFGNPFADPPPRGILVANDADLQKFVTQNFDEAGVQYRVRTLSNGEIYLDLSMNSPEDIQQATQHAKAQNKDGRIAEWMGDVYDAAGTSGLSRIDPARAGIRSVADGDYTPRLRREIERARDPRLTVAELQAERQRLTDALQKLNPEDPTAGHLRQQIKHLLDLERFATQREAYQKEVEDLWQRVEQAQAELAQKQAEYKVIYDKYYKAYDEARLRRTPAAVRSPRLPPDVGARYTLLKKEIAERQTFLAEANKRLANAPYRDAALNTTEAAYQSGTMNVPVRLELGKDASVSSVTAKRDTGVTDLRHGPDGLAAGVYRVGPDGEPIRIRPDDLHRPSLDEIDQAVQVEFIRSLPLDITPEMAMDAFQGILDLVELIPGIGTGVAVANGAISLARGRPVDAAIRFLAMVPALAPATMAKIARKAAAAVRLGKRKVSKALAAKLARFGNAAEVAAAREATEKGLAQALQKGTVTAKEVEEGFIKNGWKKEAAQREVRRLHALKVIEPGGCFLPGTPLMTPTGAKAVELFQPGDLILSRAEDDPDGPITPQVVEEVFVQIRILLEVCVQGRTIPTTGEHPFYVLSRGWIPAIDLKPGDLLTTHDGQSVAVEALVDTGRPETVYNLRVANHHTYFVGCPQWGFSVWAHNTCGYEKMLTMFGNLEHDEKYWQFYQDAVKHYAKAIEAGTSPQGARISLSKWWADNAPIELRKASAGARSDLWSWVVHDAESLKPGTKLPRAVPVPRPPLDQTKGLARLAKHDPANYGEGQLRPYAAAKDLPTHPKHAPVASEWRKDCGTGKPGEIYIARDGTWVFVDSEGHAVPYVKGFPDFAAAGVVKDTVVFKDEAGNVVKYAGNRTTDFKYADKTSSTARNRQTQTWHHHEDLNTLQLVDKAVHGRFSHRGGVSLIKNGR